MIPLLLLVNQFASIVDGSPYGLDAAEDSDTALYSLIGQRVRSATWLGE